MAPGLVLWPPKFVFISVAKNQQHGFPGFQIRKHTQIENLTA